MITGTTLQNLAKRISDERPLKRDFIADTSKLKIIQADGLRLKMEVGEQSFALALRPNFHAQLADRLKIPMPYYNRMLKEAPELLTSNANHWLTSAPEKRMIRTLDGSALAFLSERFRPLDNFDLLEHMLPKIQAAGAKVESAEATEARLYIQAIFPKLRSEVKVGDVVESGVIISNSEIGRGSLSISPLIHRLACLNGMVVPDASLRKYHVGRAMGGDDEAAAELFSDATKQADDKAFWMKANDIVDAALDATRFESFVAKLRKAAGIKLPEPIAAVEITADKFNLRDGEKNDVLKFLIEGGDLSLYGLAQAVTATANDMTDYDRAVEMEKFGGQIIELPQAIFSNN